MSPVTKAARQAQIAGILAHTRVRLQEELADILAERGIRVAQATLSRDLEELGAVRLRGRGGALVYALPGEPGGPGSAPGGLAGPGPASAGPAAPGSAGAGPGWSTSTSAGEGAGRPAGATPGGPAGASGGVNGAHAGGHLARLASELLVSAEASANLVVLRTPAGGAQLLASGIDHAEWPSILGTVAGDDTVLVITRHPAGGEAVAEALLHLAERRGP